jgi:acyl carrier protein
VSSSSVEDRVKDIIAEQLGLAADEVRPEFTFSNDLGADDLDFMEIVMALEEEFEIEIDDDEAECFSTVQSAIDFISRRNN